MPQIGHFTRDKSNFYGRVHTLTLHRDLIIVPTEHADAGYLPDFRIHSGTDDGPEIGVAWKRTGIRNSEYLSVLLDDPAWPQPIRAHLLRNDDAGSSWSLHWNRPIRHDELD